MAPDADTLMRIGTRGSPSWRGLSLQTGYVGADCYATMLKSLADGAGHTFFEQAVLEGGLGQRLFELAGFGAERLDLIGRPSRAVSPARRFLPASRNSLDQR